MVMSLLWIVFGLIACIWLYGYSGLVRSEEMLGQASGSALIIFSPYLLLVVLYYIISGRMAWTLKNIK